MKKLLVFAIALLLCAAVMGTAMAEYGYTKVSRIPAAVDFTFDVTFDAEGMPHVVTDYPYKATGAEELNLTYSKGDILEAVCLNYNFATDETRIRGFSGKLYTTGALDRAYQDLREGELTLSDKVCINTAKEKLTATDWFLFYSISNKAYVAYEERTNSQSFNGMGAGGQSQYISYKDGVLDISEVQKRSENGDLCIYYDANGDIKDAHVFLHRGEKAGSYDYVTTTGLFGGYKLSELGYHDDDINTSAPAALGSKRDPNANQKIEAYVTRCYEIILGRTPDESGLKTWYNELNSGRKTASEIIDRFVNSPEFTGKKYSNEEAVDILYRAMLGRNADAAGKANWVKKLENGQTLAHVINGFCFSKEFKDLCYSYSIKAGFVNIPETDTTAEGKIKAFVQRCYRIILDREADPSGMQTWYEQLSSGKKAAAEIIDRFVNSPEFSGKNYNSGDSVEILYKAMLGRGSDAAGKANWVGKLDAGQPFAVVINGFCVSKEFTGICASYGIKPGSVTIQPLSGVADEEALSMLALNAKEPITRRSETKPNRVEIINPSDTIDMNIGTAVQAVYINEEKAKEFIGRCYRVILGREANQAELENWIGQMVNGTKTPNQIARGFLFSNEFKAKNLGNEELIKILYKVYMNREADPEGLKTWTEKLNGGTSLNDLLDTFSKTNEFKKVVSEMSK